MQVAVVSCVCRLNTLDVPEPVSTGTLHKAGSVSQLFGEQMRRGESVLQTCFMLKQLVPQAVQVIVCCMWHVIMRYTVIADFVNLDGGDFFCGHHPCWYHLWLVLTKAAFPSLLLLCRSLSAQWTCAFHPFRFITAMRLSHSCLMHFMLPGSVVIFQVGL